MRLRKLRTLGSREHYKEFINEMVAQQKGAGVRRRVQKPFGDAARERAGRGVDEGEATRAARREFGNVELVGSDA